MLPPAEGHLLAHICIEPVLKAPRKDFRNYLITAGTADHSFTCRQQRRLLRQAGCTSVSDCIEQFCCS